METRTVIEGFEKFLRSGQKSSSETESGKVLESMKILAECDKNRIEGVMPLVENYLSLLISRKYSLLSDELFELKRYLTLEKKGEKWGVIYDNVVKESGKQIKCVEIPLVAKTSLDAAEREVDLGQFEDSSGFSRNLVHLKAKLPGKIGEEQRAQAREAVGYYYTVLGEAFSSPFVGRALMKESYGNERPYVQAIWIPTPDSLELVVEAPIRNYDPALVMTARKRNYLVATWVVKNERPLEGILREFSLTAMKHGSSNK